MSLLLTEPRVGAPRTITDEVVEAVIVKTLETLPQGETHWSTRTIAAKAGMSHTMVGRIWRTFGLKPHLTESFMLSPDPQLETKAGDVTLKVPKLRGLPSETAIIERDRRREASVEQALVEMYLAGVSVRRVEDTTEALWARG